MKFNERKTAVKQILLEQLDIHKKRNLQNLGLGKEFSDLS